MFTAGPEAPAAAGRWWGDSRWLLDEGFPSLRDCDGWTSRVGFDRSRRSLVATVWRSGVKVIDVGELDSPRHVGVDVEALVAVILAADVPLDVERDRAALDSLLAATSEGGAQ